MISKNRNDNAAPNRRITAKEEPARAPERSVQKPAMFSGRTLTLLAVAVVVIALSAMASYWMNRSVTISEFTFTGHYFTTESELNAAAAPFMNQPVDSVNYMKLITALEQNRYVKRADINVETNGRLDVVITERTPLALLSSGADRVYVDREGVKLPVILGKAVDLPVLYGFSASALDDTLSDKAFDRARDFLVAVSNDPLADATISEVALDPVEGVVALSHENGVKLIFGDDTYGERLHYWASFYAKVISKKGIERFRSIDFRFEGQIVAKETRS